MSKQLQLFDRDVLRAKLADAETPALEVEFDPAEAEAAGAFVEQALNEADALESSLMVVLPAGLLARKFVFQQLKVNDLVVELSFSRCQFGGALRVGMLAIVAPASVFGCKVLFGAIKLGVLLAEIGFAPVELLLTLGLGEPPVVLPAGLLGSVFVFQAL